MWQQDLFYCEISMIFAIFAFLSHLGIKNGYDIYNLGTGLWALSKVILTDIPYRKIEPGALILSRWTIGENMAKKH